jgi:Phospholipase/lecithinase/hemolysin
MSRFLRNAAIAVLTAVAAGTVASAASAQSYSRIIVFGDSLSDNGNLYAISGNPISPPYYQGRFSNGPVFTELLGFTVGRYTAGASMTGSINFAFGGARTDSSASPPGMLVQRSLYTGTFGASDLVSILGGANDIFQAFPGAAGSSNPTGVMLTTVTTAANNINTLVNSVAAAGAGTVLVTNLPRLGTTPQFRATGANGMALADYAGQQFNSILLTNLMNTAAARPNTNIIMMDLYKGGEAIAANPGAFGLTNVTNTCLVGVTVCATPDTYMFWDGVHPTAKGHQLLAMLANDYLYYGDNGAQSTVYSEIAYRQREEALDMAAEGGNARGEWQEGTQVTFGVLADSVKYDARGPISSAKADGWGGRIGFDGVMSQTFRMGVAASFRNTDVTAGAMNGEVETYGVDGYFGWRNDGWFVTGAGGFSIDQYDQLERITRLAPIVHSASTSGGSAGGKLTAGTWMEMGGIAISPRASLTYIRSKTDPYTETGAAAALDYERRVTRALSGEVALRAEGGGDGMHFHVEGGYRDEFSRDDDGVRVGIAGNPAHVLTREFDDPFGGSMFANFGASVDVGMGDLSIGYRGRFGEDATSHLAGISLSIPLN